MVAEHPPPSPALGIATGGTTDCSSPRWWGLRLESVFAESGPRFRSGAATAASFSSLFARASFRTGAGVGSISCGMKGSAPRCRFTPFSARSVEQ